MPDELPDRLQRILTGPEQDRLIDALAADAVDAAPVVGDLLALQRRQNAEEHGIEYPDRPAYIENILSDLPPPVDTVGDIVVSQNVLHHLEERDERR